MPVCVVCSRVRRMDGIKPGPHTHHQPVRATALCSLGEMHMVAASPSIAVAGRRPARSKFFVWIALAMLVVIALGFGKSFFLRPVFTDKPLPTYLIMHGATMTAWHLLFLLQASLAAFGRIDLHRRVGMAGVALAIAVVVTAVVVNLNLVPRMQGLGLINNAEQARQGASFALASMSSLLPFAVLVLLAVLWRRKPAVHKRLMFWSVVWTLGPAFTRERPLGAFLDPLVAPYLPFFPSDLFWLAALMLYDWKTLHRIHPATYVPFILLALFFFFGQGWFAGNAALQDWVLSHAQLGYDSP